MGFHKNVDDIITGMIEKKTLFTKVDLEKLRETLHYLHNLSWEKKGIKLEKHLRPINFKINKNGTITIIE